MLVVPAAATVRADTTSLSSRRSASRCNVLHCRTLCCPSSGHHGNSVFALFFFPKPHTPVATLDGNFACFHDQTGVRTFLLEVQCEAVSELRNRAMFSHMRCCSTTPMDVGPLANILMRSGKRSVYLGKWYTARALSKASPHHTLLKCLTVKGATSPMRRHKKTEIKVPFKGWQSVQRSSVYQSCWAG